MTGWALNAALASTLLMAAVLLVRMPMRRAFGPTITYALWALLALRLLLPPLPEAWSAHLPIGRTAGYAVLASTGAGDLPDFGRFAASVDWSAWAITTWGVVAGLFLLRHVADYLRFRRNLLRDGSVIDRVDSIQVVRSPAASGPLACGVLRPLIVLPANFGECFSREEQAFAICHELGHHRRGDLFANWAALIVLALHWWNPLAWAAHRAFRADQELANDAFVLATRPGSDRAVYAETILKTTLGGAWTPVCNLNSRLNLKERIAMLARTPNSRRRSILGRSTIGIAVAVGVGSTAAYALSPEVQIARQVTTIIVKPDGRGSSTLLADGVEVAAGTALPTGATLPIDFVLPAGCEKDARTPQAMIIKGEGGEQTYTVVCARNGPNATAGSSISTDEAYAQALTGLRALRADIRTQTPWRLPEAERGQIIAVVDISIAEITRRATAAR